MNHSLSPKLVLWRCKFPLVLAMLMGMLMGTIASTAHAQLPPAFQCTANAGVPPNVRAEGIAELVGDVVLNCTGGTPTALGDSVPQANLRVFLNVNVTSWLIDGPENEALLVIDDPAASVQRLCPASATCPLTGVIVRDKATQALANITLRLRWSEATQALTTINAVPVS